MPLFIKRKNKHTTAHKPPDKEERKGCLNLLACFRRPRIDEPEDGLRAGTAAEHKNNKLRLLPWFPWPKCKRKKKKMKKTIPFDLQCASSSLSFVPSNSNTSTPEFFQDRSNKGWCKRKQKTPSATEAQTFNGSAAPSRTTSVESLDRYTPFGPRSSTSQPHGHRNNVRSDHQHQRSVYHTASDHIVNRIGGRRLGLGAGLWVMVTSLGVMLFFGRTGAVLFLSSCWYMVPLVIDTILSTERRWRN